jgi:transposase
MTTKNRKRFEPEFKARVALEALREQQSLSQIGRRHGVHPVVVGQWKKRLAGQAVEAFSKRGTQDSERTHDELLRKIGELTVERDFLANGLRRFR